jgi:hypothetical protein
MVDCIWAQAEDCRGQTCDIRIFLVFAYKLCFSCVYNLKVAGAADECWQKQSQLSVGSVLAVLILSSPFIPAILLSIVFSYLWFSWSAMLKEHNCMPWQCSLMRRIGIHEGLVILWLWSDFSLWPEISFDHWIPLAFISRVRYIHIYVDIQSPNCDLFYEENRSSKWLWWIIIIKNVKSNMFCILLYMNI